MIKIKLPEAVDFILNSLYNSKYISYIVGGCVRDSLLNIIPKDWDITTNATPIQIKEVFKDYQVISTGEQYGTVTIMLNNIPYEITTFRFDGNYSDGRRPDKVIFGKEIKDDLSRRDFTINAMAYNKQEGLIDLFNGQQDLVNKLIRCVGNCSNRFLEDALRMLRAIRFSCRFGFEIAEEEVIFIKNNLNLLKNVSQERITSELKQILNHSNMLTSHVTNLLIQDLIKYLSLGYVELNHHNTSNYLEKIVLITENIVNLENSLKELKFSNDEVNDVVISHRILDLIVSTKDEDEDYMLSQYEFGKINHYISKLKIFNIDNIINLIGIAYCSKELAKHVYIQCNNTFIYELNHLKINGNDLLKLKVEPKRIGKILEDCLEQVMREQLNNNFNDLLQYVLKIIDC